MMVVRMPIPEIKLPPTVDRILRTITATENARVLRLSLVTFLLMSMAWLCFGKRFSVHTRLFRKSHPTYRTQTAPSGLPEIDNRPYVDLTEGDYSEVDRETRPPNDLGFSAADVSPEQNAPMTPERAAFEFFLMKARVKTIENQLGIKSQWPEMTR